MTRLIALLALVSGLLIPAQAYACNKPQDQKQVELIFDFLKVKYFTMEGNEAKRYLAVINAEPPETDLESAVIHISVGDDRVSVAAMDGSNICTMDFLTYAPELHHRAMKSAKGEPV
jgi:hypothetical protein